MKYLISSLTKPLLIGNFLRNLDCPVCYRYCCQQQDYLVTELVIRMQASFSFIFADLMHYCPFHFLHFSIIFVSHLSALTVKIPYSKMQLGRWHIYFISGYAIVFPNVKVLLFPKNTGEPFFSTTRNHCVKPNLLFPCTLTFHFICNHHYSCHQYRKERWQQLYKTFILSQSMDNAPVLSLLECFCIIPYIGNIYFNLSKRTTPECLEVRFLSN